MAEAASDAVAVFHYAVMGYIVFGGFLVWRWRWTLAPHLAIITWAVISLLYPVICPLTWLENHFRTEAGLGALHGGFIRTYVTGVLYPANMELFVQVLCAAIVLFSWAGAYVHRRHRLGAADSSGTSEDRVELV